MTVSRRCCSTIGASLSCGKMKCPLIPGAKDVQFMAVGVLIRQFPLGARGNICPPPPWESRNLLLFLFIWLVNFVPSPLLPSPLTTFLKYCYRCSTVVMHTQHTVHSPLIKHMIYKCTHMHVNVHVHCHQYCPSNRCESHLLDYEYWMHPPKSTVLCTWKATCCNACSSTPSLSKYFAGNRVSLFNTQVGIDILQP